MAFVLRDKPRLLIPGLLLLLVAGWVLVMPASEQPDISPPQVPLLKVSSVLAEPGTVSQTLHVTGNLVARDEVSIGTALQDTRIARVLVEEGDTVVAGQLLAQLETDTLDAQVRQAEATLNRNAALIKQQQALDTEAQASLARINELGSIGAVSAQQLDQQRAQAHSSAAALAAAQAEHQQAIAQLTDARTRRDKAIILAPVNGIISERHARLGAMAGSEPLFKLIRDGQLELDGELAQSALQTIRVGTEVQVQVAGMADSVAGTVRLLAPKVDAGTRLGRVRISLAATADVRAGSFASSRIETGTTAAAVVIPLRAVTFADDGGATVMVLDIKGQASVRSVVLGQRNSLRVQVSSGLAAGERVVASASAFVRNGDVVSLAQELEQ